MAINPMSYEAQFFGFTPQTCILRVHNAIKDYLFDMMLLVERVILKKLVELPDSNISTFQIRESTENFLSFMNERFEQLFNKVEQMLLTLVLKVPENIFLPQDKVHKRYPYSKEQYEQLECEITQLEKRYKAEICAKQTLLAELEEQKAVQAEMEKIIQWFDTLDNTCRENGFGDFKESLTFMTQSSKKLQEKMQEIKEKKTKIWTNKKASAIKRV
ncbi:protein MIS12 homolog [Latimeria chalumnae]|uniref:Protein MIS12 homolog n=1 Tax=Latimeria chalumnae TaxID=7897 RepID=H3BFQ6_LATCH|nr:PREDICTED: protein MIS12 homolog [Latimeria chalumnae]|eukprot:XP_005988630.1 PREDICTED: protein MIS12 homolog [Latimeria chalumnae]